MSNCKMTCNTTTVGGVTGDESIANMWRDSFEQLYNMHDNSGLLSEFSAYML